MANFTSFFQAYDKVPYGPSVGELKQLLCPVTLNAEGLWEDSNKWLWYPMRGQSIGRSTSAADIAVDKLEKLYLQLYTFVGSVAGYSVTGSPTSAQNAWDNNEVLTIPDYRGRTALGAGQGASLTDRPLASTGGEETHTLTRGELPSSINIVRDSGTQETSIVRNWSEGSRADLEPLGSDEAHNNMPPWFSVEYFMALGERVTPEFLVEKTVEQHESEFDHSDLALVDNFRTAPVARSFLEVNYHKYVIADPVAKPIDQVLISTTGQLYSLAPAVPTDRPCLVQLFVAPGLADNATWLSIYVEGETSTSRGGASSVSSTYNTALSFPSFGGYYNSGGDVRNTAGTIFVPTTTGKIWMEREGSYLSSTYYTSVYVLGWFEGDPST